MAELIMWTVYDWGTDGVSAYTVRGWSATAAGLSPVTDALTFLDLDLMRAELRGMGLTQIIRSLGDEPHILETWL